MADEHTPGTRAATAPAQPRQTDLRGALAGFATGVTVVAVGGAHPHAMTANAFTSVSLDPPLVLVCVHREAQMHRALAAARVFGVSVLAVDQQPLARYYASSRRPGGAAQFAGVDWTPGSCTGAPLLDHAVAWFECTPWHRYDGGDHSIVVGELVAATRAHGVPRSPLLFFDSEFRSLTTEVRA